MMELNFKQIRQNIKLWLDEDIGTGDVTTMYTIPADQQSKGIIHLKESGIVAGLRVAQEVFAEVDENLVFSPQVKEGEFVSKGR